MVSYTNYQALSGINQNANQYTTVQGALTTTVRTATLIADNVSLNRQKMITNRRGFDYVTNGTPNYVVAFAEYQNLIVELESDGTLFHSDLTGTRGSYSGSFIPISPYRMDFAVGRGSLFFTCTAGPQKLDTIAGTPTRSGLTKGLDVRLATSGTGAGFMSGYSKVGYHITWLRTDSNNQQVRSDTSTRPTLTNFNRVSLSGLTQTLGTATATTVSAHGFTSGDTIHMAGASPTNYNGDFVITSTGASTFTYVVAGAPASPATGTITAEKYLNTTVQFTVPWDVATGDSYEIWRTVTVDASNADPGDNCFLVSRVINAGAAGSTITFTDTTSDTTLTSSLPLYTNATQEGALTGNARPPLASSICTYKDVTLFGNAAIDHQLSLNLLAVVSLVTSPTANYARIVITDDTVARTYICGTGENVSTHTFLLHSGGSSTAADIENTVRSIVHVVNGDSAGHWYAEYNSSINDNPGIFRIWARSPTTGAFHITTNNVLTGNQFDPVLPTSGTTVLSDDDSRQNRIFYSKFAEPESVPILNTIDIGRQDCPILRLIPVRDAVFVLKSDGIFTLTGLTAPFAVTELDGTCRCIAPASAVALNNQVFLFSDSGVVKVSSSGVAVISYDIDPTIQAALGMSNLAATCFGVADETVRQYHLFLPSASNDTYATQSYVWHNFIESWVRWSVPARAGIALNVNYSMYLSSFEKAVLKQRRSGDSSDYSDQELAITIVSQTGTTVTFTWANTNFVPTAGISLHQSATISKVTSVTFVSGTTWRATLALTSISFSAGAATARLPIYAAVRVSPNAVGQPGMQKTFYEVVYLLASDSVSQATIEVATNESASFNQYTITRQISSGWGVSAWGNAAWGDTVSAARTIPWSICLPIPDITGEAVTSGWIHAVSQEQFLIAQVGVVFEKLAEYGSVV